MEPRPTERLIRAYRDSLVELDSEGMFATRCIFPDAFANELEHGTMLLTPVHAGSDHYGYLLIDPKGIDLSLIDSVARCIGNALRSHYLIEALESQAVRPQEANEGLPTLANRDALTGLPNRLCFEHRLHELCESGGNNNRFVLFFFDLDGFKMVNDVYGHEIVDELLKSVSKRLESVVQDISGDHGFVARLGGDEFTAIVKSSNLEEDLDRLLSTLLIALVEEYWFSGQALQVSASIGSAVFPDNGDDTKTLLKCADTAMHKAKTLGKNRSVRYSQESDSFSSSPSVARRAGGFSRILTIAQK